MSKKGDVRDALNHVFSRDEFGMELILTNQNTSREHLVQEIVQCIPEDIKKASRAAVYFERLSDGGYRIIRYVPYHKQ